MGDPLAVSARVLGIVTNRRIYQPPTAPDAALQHVESLLRSPSLVLLSETDAHWQTLRALFSTGHVIGGRVHDARIAAICLEHGVPRAVVGGSRLQPLSSAEGRHPLVQ